MLKLDSDKKIKQNGKQFFFLVAIYHCKKLVVILEDANGNAPLVTIGYKGIKVLLSGIVPKQFSFLCQTRVSSERKFLCLSVRMLHCVWSQK